MTSDDDRADSPPVAGPAGKLDPLGVSRVVRPEASVSVLVVRGLIQTVEQAGVARAAFLSAAQVEPERLERADARFPRSETLRMCELAVELTSDVALGLHWVENLTERMFVPISHLLAHCASLRQALEMLAHFYPLLSDHADYRVVEQGEQICLRCEVDDVPSARAQRFTGEMMVGGFLRLVQSFSPRARAEASFAYPAPHYARAYDTLFQGSQRFDQPFTGLSFDRALLEAPAQEKDDGVREALQTLAERRLQQFTHGSSVEQRVREYLLRDGWPHRTDMASVARALKTSVRTLRRRLGDEGKTYHDVLSEALATIAKTFLRGQRYTIQEVAYEMGFSDAATFHRAYKRWTGMTPSAYRKLHQKEPSS